jgi:hypothetical protein
VTPAVVNVYASRVERRQANPLFDDPFFQRFFGQRPGGQTSRSLGSGVIVEASGLVVTNNHVIEGMTNVKVALADRREFDAEIVLRDPRTDLAVLRIKGGKDFTAIELGDSDALEIGDIVLAIGNPFGVGQTVTQGIVSALARTQTGISDYGFFIQTDAAINPGNSGGALVDMSGRIIGVNSAIYSRSGGSVGIGFAIPANMVRVVVANARGGRALVRRPWLGAGLQAVALGTPVGRHAAFDAADVRWALTWRRRFLDAMTTWEERAATPARPLGDAITALPEWRALARLSSADAPWPLLNAEGVAYRYKGFSVGSDGIPTFHYEVGSLRVDDTLRPDGRSGGYRRTVALRGGTPGWYFRGATAGSVPRQVIFNPAGVATLEEILP